MATAMAQAVVFTKPGTPLELRGFPVPTRLSPGHALLRLQRSGICGTDVHIVEGRLAVPPPFIPGHEFIGSIVATGRGATRDALGNVLKAGDSAIACVARPCGRCFSCQRDETASCLNFGVTYLKDPAAAPHFHGGFGEVLVHPSNGLVKVPAGIDLDAVAAFPCGGPTAIRAFDFAGNLAGDELVVVQGTGAIGLFSIAWAARAGCTVVSIGSGSNPLRLRLARQLGARVVYDYRRTTVEQRRAEILKLATRLKRGNGADVVLEASGSPQAIVEGLQLCRTLGRYIVPGQYSSSGPVAIQPELITFKAIRIVGSGQYKISDIATYLSFLRKHKALQPVFARCVTHKYALADARKAFSDAAAGVSIKGVFIRD